MNIPTTFSSALKKPTCARMQAREWWPSQPTASSLQTAPGPATSPPRRWSWPTSASVTPCVASGLGKSAQRKQRAGQLLLGKAEEEVGLVLGMVHAAQQLPAVRSLVEADARVMSGGDLAGAYRIGHLQEAIEFDVVVAERTRNGRAPGQVLFHERFDHVLLELAFEVDHVIRDTDLLGDAAGVVHVVERAAAPGCAFHRKARQPALVPELHGEADDVY